MSFCVSAMAAARTGGEGPDRGDHQHRGRRLGEDRVGAGDHVDAGVDHRRGVDERRHRGRALHRVGQPDVQRELGGLADGAGEQEEGDDRDRALVQCADPLEDLAEAQCPEVDPDHHDPEAEPEVADAVDDERLLGCAGRRGLLVPEADEQIAAQADRLPADVQHQEVVAQDQQQHAEHEQVQVGEEAPEAPVAVHVADRVDVDEEPDRADDEQQHRGQGVDEEAHLDPEVARHDPLVDSDLVLVLAEDDVGEDDHRDDPHQSDEPGRDDPGPIARPLRARRDVPGLAEPVVQVGRDDPGGSLGVGEVVRMAGMRARGLLLLLGRDLAEA